MKLFLVCWFFFFQAEDGIRDDLVTGVQTCALPISLTVDDHTSASGVARYMLGREPVVTRDGAPLVDRKARRSYVTSAGAGPSIGKHILMAYLPPARANVGDELAVEDMHERFPVTVVTTDATPGFAPEHT